MRKVFTLLLFTVLATIGMRAQEEVTGNFGTSSSSSYSIVSRVMTITINSTDDYSGWVTDGWGTTQEKLVNDNNVSKVVFKTGEGVTIPSDCASSYNVWYWISNVSGKVNTIDFRNCAFVDNKVTGLNLNYKNFNVIVPDACESASSFFTGNNHNYFKVSSTTLYASLNGSVKVVWDNVKNECTTLAIQGTVSTALDLSSSGFTNFDFYNTTVNADITVPDKATVKVSTEDAKNHIKGSDLAFDYTAPAEPFNGTLPATGGSVSSAIDNYNEGKEESEKISADHVKYLEVTGTLTAEDITYINGTLTSLETLKMSGVTALAEGADLQRLTSSSVTMVILPNVSGVSYSSISNLPNLKLASSSDGNVVIIKDLSILSNIPDDIKTNATVYVFIGDLSSANVTAINLFNPNSSKTIVKDFSYATFVDKETAKTTLGNPECATDYVFADGDKGLSSIGHSNLKNVFTIVTTGEGENKKTSLELNRVWDSAGLGRCSYLVNQITSKSLCVKVIGLSSVNLLDDFAVEKIDFGTNYITDFSTLNSTTHYITVRTSSDIMDENSYKYNENIYAVSNVNSGQTTFDGTTYTGSINAVYVRKPGGLKDAANYASEAQNTVDIMIVGGEINSDDVSTMGYSRAPQVNFSHATIQEGSSIDSYSNKYVEYVALPHNVRISEEIKSNCPSLKAIGTIVDESTGEKEASTVKTLYYYANKGGSAPVVTQMLKSLASQGSKIENLVMSGKLYYIDIVASGTQTSIDGHYYTGEGATTDGAFTSQYPISLKSADFSEALFYEVLEYNNGEDAETQPVKTQISDMMFSKCGLLSSVTSIKLPTSSDQKLLPATCLENFSNITNLCIPYNYEVIGHGALYNVGTSHITTTDPDNDVIVDYGDNTITLSANLKAILCDQALIGQITATIAGGGIDDVTDVYVLASNAPICQEGSFSIAQTYGNNGYNFAHPISREIYKNGNKLITVLHYPYASNQSEYTDVTRVYTMADETGASDARGNTVMWPTQSDFNRSYYQAKSGYIWNAWEYKDGNGSVITGAGTTPDVKNETATYNKNKYCGWHEFILSKTFNVKNITPQTHYTEYVQKDWYTFCVPYNLTKSQVLEALGIDSHKGGSKKYKDLNNVEHDVTEDMYPDIRTLVGVTRAVNTKNTVTFHLSKDLATAGQYVKLKDDGKSYEYISEGDDPIVIKGGYPYIIRPYLPNESEIKSLTKYVVAVAENQNFAEGYKYNNGGKDIVLPYESYSVWAKNGDKSTSTETVWVNDNDGAACKYHFIGSYADKLTVPEYAYYMGIRKSDGVHQFFRSTSGILTLGQYSAIIIPRSSVGFTFPDDASTVMNLSCQDDLLVLDSENTSGSKPATISFQFDNSSDNVATGIVDVRNDMEYSNNACDNHYYNLNGQMVGKSQDKLSKGIYIVNGKKVVVR